MKTFLIITLIALFILFIFLYLRFVKRLSLKNLTLITGGVKCGKTTLAVALSVKQYEKELKSYFFRKKVCSLLHIKFTQEMPLFYSNIPVVVKYRDKEFGYVPLSIDLLTRNKRFAYGSIILVSESSLVIDSFDVKDRLLNETSKLFNKLIAHETLGGKIFYETQSLSDNHHSLKRCLDSYIWINNCYKLPFVLAYDVRELAYSYDNSSVSNIFSDTETKRKYVFVSKKWWKRFDTYCYSKLTDDKEIVTERVYTNNDLKCDDVLSYRGIIK